jgi:predicted ATPase
VAQVLREGLELPAGVTFLVGENGSGKSTLIEGIAGAFGLGLEGGGRQSLHQTYASESGLHERLRLVRGAGGTRNGFFLRAETMHGFFTYLAREVDAAGYHEMSHGESFLEAMAWYFRHPGFFCLNEPEAALSFSSTLVLVGQLHALVAQRDAFTMWTAPAATDAPACLALELELLHTFREEGLTAAELDFVKRYLVRSHAFEIDTARKRVHQRLEAELFDLPAGYHERYLERVEEVSVESARAAVQGRLSEDDLVIGVVGTHAEIGAAIEKAIPRLSHVTVAPFDLE